MNESDCKLITEKLLGECCYITDTTGLLAQTAVEFLRREV
jgi:hypothetical protein